MVVARVARWAMLALFIRIASVEAATITVNDASDVVHHQCSRNGTGVCSLRDAIVFANKNPGSDSIVFGIGIGPQTIRPLSPLPQITDPIGIEGQTQQGGIEIDGSLAGPAVDGLRILAGPSGVNGISIYGFSGNAIVLQGSRGSILPTVFLGLDLTNTVRGNGGAGVLILGSTSNSIGMAGQLRGAIAGNQDGVRIEGPGADGNLILGPNIGANTGDGIAVLSGSGNTIVDSGIYGNGGNGIMVGAGASETIIQENGIDGNAKHGILLDESSNNQIGGSGGTSLANTIVNSGGDAIRLTNGANQNIIQGNYLGLASLNGTNAGAGIRIVGSNRNVIGGTIPVARNVINYNGGPGVAVEGKSSRNTISGNSIVYNSRGIDLGADGPTPNDPCDVDSGPNNLQNFPILTSALSGANSITVQGALESAPMATYSLEFFSNSVCDPAGQGQAFLGSTSVTTNASCAGGFSATLPIISNGATWITATATDSLGNTSEFSDCVPVAMQYYPLSPCRAADTRLPQPSGGQPIPAGGEFFFQIAGHCGVPLTAQAVSFNVTVTQSTAQGSVRVFPFTPHGVPSLLQTVAYDAGQTRANNAIVALGEAGYIVAYVDQPSGSAHFIADVNGYFQ